MAERSHDRGGPGLLLYWYGVLPLHALVFRGLLRRIAHRAVRGTAPGDLSRFTYSSIIGAPAADVFRWHERPEALVALTPAALVRIEQRQGGIRDDGRVTVLIGLGRVSLRWSILARAPHLDDDAIAVARAAARDNGFDVARLMPTSHGAPLDHDADGRKDRVPNRPHAMGEVPPRRWQTPQLR